MTYTITSYLQASNHYNIIKQYLSKAQELNESYNACVRRHNDYIQQQQDTQLSRDLKALPVFIKDNILTKDYISSCGSAMLQNYTAPYSASCFSKLEQAGALMLGKANMDEFAMGSSNETSFFGPVTNPHGNNRVAGGSSGGSAAAVASDMCIAALGTDTGGSIRQPAALCGIVGIKPSYGMVSRYGVQALASSLDQVGTFAKNVEDAFAILDVIAGYDPKDATSDPRADQKNFMQEQKPIENYRIAIPRQFMDKGLDTQIKNSVEQVVSRLRAIGLTVDEVDMPILHYTIPTYYTLMTAEASSNLARFDGIRYGLQDDTMEFDTIHDYMTHIRSQGFGEEVKRRILLGTYVLSSAHYQGLYIKAKQAAAAMQSAFTKLFSSYDIVLSPTSPELARHIGAKQNNPLAMYLADLYTIPANICGFPAMSQPIGFGIDNDERLPIGLQLMADQRQEHKLYQLGKYIQDMLS